MSKLILSAIQKNKSNESLFENLNGFLKGKPSQDYVEVPIEVNESNWKNVDEQDRTYLTRTFYFNSLKHMRYFLNESLKESERIFHHPKMIVDNETITVELYTHDMNDVSNLDISLSKFMDEIFGEIQLISEI